MRARTLILATILAALAPAATSRAEQAGGEPTRQSHLFPRPASLEPQIRFWQRIFAEYSTHQVVLHDALHLDKVYKVLDFRPYLDDMSDGQLERLERVEVDDELDHLRAILRRLHGLNGNPDGLTAEERHVYEMFADDPSPDRFLAAADDKRLHSQRGLRERFGEGVRVSRRYMPEMERIFREEGLPVELTRLPLIESCFNLRAYSKAGAAGIWQFMPSTGRLFLRVDNVIDERRDPIVATRAAARFLARMHDSLDTWPLAITAYNHGPEGIARAVRATGTTDIATIVSDYRGSSFGFASRNFYAEFLAALDVERDAGQHFGEMPHDRPFPTREHRLERSLGIETAARLAGSDRGELAELNPAFSSLVLTGRRPIPPGYRLRLPEDAAADFEERVAALGGEPRVTRVAASASTAPRKTRGRNTVVSYRVRPGQTLSHIAKQHKVTVASLRTTNRLGKAGQLRSGQVLKIPVAQLTM